MLGRHREAVSHRIDEQLAPPLRVLPRAHLEPASSFLTSDVAPIGTSMHSAAVSMRAWRKMPATHTMDLDKVEASLKTPDPPDKLPALLWLHAANGAACLCIGVASALHFR